jgi:hypothetical protein
VTPADTIELIENLIQLANHPLGPVVGVAVAVVIATIVNHNRRLRRELDQRTAEATDV